MARARVERDQIAVSLLTAHLGEDYDMRRDLIVEHLGPDVDDEAAGEALDALIRLCCALRASLRNGGLSNSMELPNTATGRTLMRAISLCEGLVADDSVKVAVPVDRGEAASLALLALDVAGDLLERCAANVALDRSVFVQRLALQIAAEAAA